MSKSKFISILVFCAFLGSSPMQAASCPAANLIQDAGSAFSAAARSGTASAFTSAASRFTDLRGIAIFALGSFRGALPPAQESKYIALAKGFIGRFMADNASSLAGSNNLTITSCSGNSVSAKMASGGTVIFRLSSGSRIQDVNVSGIWVAQALRDKFTGVIRSNGGDVNALFAYLAQ
jgi:ABC-type transporter MlaC component